MYKAIYKFAMLTSVVVLASSAAACSRSGDNDQSSSITGPSDPEAARGGNGNGRKPTGGSSGSLAWALVTDATGNGAPTWGDTITFTWSTSATTQPVIELTCRQGGVIVLSRNAGFYDSYPWPWERNMMLSSSAWQSGAADCSAILFPLGDRSNVLATTSFHVGE